jgi:hypothetical protein
LNCKLQGSRSQHPFIMAKDQGNLCECRSDCNKVQLSNQDLTLVNSQRNGSIDSNSTSSTNERPLSCSHIPNDPSRVQRGSIKACHPFACVPCRPSQTSKMHIGYRQPPHEISPLPSLTSFNLKIEKEPRDQGHHHQLAGLRGPLNLHWRLIPDGPAQKVSLPMPSSGGAWTRGRERDQQINNEPTQDKNGSSSLSCI